MGISNSGSRQLLIRRHTEWVNLWNANCDAVRPRTKRELLSDLDQWERSQGGAVSAVGAAFGQRGNAGGEVMAKDFDADAYGKKNKDHFGDLIAKARAGRKQAVEKKAETPVDTANDATKGDSKSEDAGAGDSAAHMSEQPADPETIEDAIEDQSPGDDSAPKLAQTPLPARPSDDAVKKPPMFDAPDDPIMDVDGEVAQQ
jgi:E3 ubiquitin-protein ligase RAD18